MKKCLYLLPVFIIFITNSDICAREYGSGAVVKYQALNEENDLAFPAKPAPSKKTRKKSKIKKQTSSKELQNKDDMEETLSFSAKPAEFTEKENTEEEVLSFPAEPALDERSADDTFFKDEEKPSSGSNGDFTVREMDDEALEKLMTVKKTEKVRGKRIGAMEKVLAGGGSLAKEIVINGNLFIALASLPVVGVGTLVGLGVGGIVDLISMTVPQKTKKVVKLYGNKHVKSIDSLSEKAVSRSVKGELGQKNVIALIKLAQRANKFIDFADEAIANFNNGKEDMKKQIESLEGDDKKAAEGIIMLADLNDGYFKALADSFANIAKLINVVLTSGFESGRKKASKQLVEELNNILKLKERYLKLYTLAASSVLKIKSVKREDYKSLPDEYLEDVESGIYSIILQILEAVGDMNDEEIKNESLRTCISTVKENLAFLEDINKLLALTFTFVLSMTPGDKKKLRKHMKYVNKHYFKN